ncbi:leucine-rich repeat-containing protein 74B-like [Haliotis rufescens]|uniref:leucine-rich repeat-containing protein 74B-like n=1 Tax=Haliotis rufescens TaxID=6454 RepID=UPI001EB01C08|nr:leucine-rich repeat-containing protein 74B-like [Haliotis rufescens]
MEAPLDLSDLELRKSILARQDQLQDYRKTESGENMQTLRQQTHSAPPGGRQNFRRLTIDRSKTISRLGNARSGVTSVNRSRACTAGNGKLGRRCEKTSYRPVTGVTCESHNNVRTHINRDSVATFCLDDDYSDSEPDEKPSPRKTSLEGGDESRHVYLAACRKLNIVPSSSYLRCVRSKVVKLNHQGLTVRAVKAVCISLVEQLTVTELHLANNDIGDAGLRCVVDMLHHNSIIHVLDVSNNNLRSPGAAMLSGLLAENDSLQVLKAAGNRFKDGDAGQLGEALAKNTTLRSLDLSHNEIRDGGGKLGKCLGLNSTLETLNLSWNHLRSAGVAGMAAGIKGNTVLRSLDLSWNGLGTEGARTVGGALRDNTTLEELALNSCRIGQQALGDLLKKMQSNNTLNTLRLSNNPITHQGAVYLVEFLRDHPSMEIHTVEISDVVVSGEFSRLIDSVRCFRPTFRVVHGDTLRGGDAVLRELQLPRMKVRDPLVVVMEHVDSQDMRLVDLFTAHDSDNKGAVSRQDFMRAIKEAGVNLEERQVQRLVDMLDRDCSGEIDFVDLIDRENKYRKLREVRVTSGVGSRGITTATASQSVASDQLIPADAKEKHRK